MPRRHASSGRAHPRQGSLRSRAKRALSSFIGPRSPAHRRDGGTKRPGDAITRRRTNPLRASARAYYSLGVPRLHGSGSRSQPGLRCWEAHRTAGVSRSSTQTPRGHLSPEAAEKQARPHSTRHDRRVRLPTSMPRAAANLCSGSVGREQICIAARQLRSRRANRSRTAWVCADGVVRLRLLLLGRCLVRPGGTKFDNRPRRDPSDGACALPIRSSSPGKALPRQRDPAVRDEHYARAVPAQPAIMRPCCRPSASARTTRTIEVPPRLARVRRPLGHGLSLLFIPAGSARWRIAKGTLP